MNTPGYALEALGTEVAKRLGLRMLAAAFGPGSLLPAQTLFHALVSSLQIFHHPRSKLRIPKRLQASAVQDAPRS